MCVVGPGVFFLISVSPNSGPLVGVWSFTETQQKEQVFGALMSEQLQSCDHANGGKTLGLF